jgi:hypothetical protein
MKAIVVIFGGTHDAKLPAGELLAIRISGNSQAVIISGADKKNHANKSTTKHNESAPPFWTWFTENPRPYPSGSFSSLADSIFAA